MGNSGRRYSKKLGVVALLAVILTACEEEPPPPAKAQLVKAMRVNDTAAFAEEWFPGQAKATREVALSFRVPGKLLRFPVNAGDEFQEGDLVAQLDSDTYRAEVDRIKATIARAEATLLNAQQQLRRDQTLFKQGHVSAARVDIRTAAMKEAASQVAAFKAQLTRATLDAGYTTLQAPFSGRVVATYVENFEDVRAQQPVLRLVDATRVEMTVAVPESLISLVPDAENFRVEFDALPGATIPAEIKEIGTEASETTRTFPVTLIMDQPTGATILPGMAGRATGDVKAVENEPARRIEIPIAATFSTGSDGQTYVWIIDEGAMTLQRRSIDVGLPGLTGIVVKDGLSAGEWIVTAGVHSVSEGQKVRILGQPESAGK